MNKAIDQTWQPACQGTPAPSKLLCFNTTFDNTSSTKEYLEFQRGSQQSPKAGEQVSRSDRSFQDLSEVHLDGHTLQAPNASIKSARCVELKINRQSPRNDCLNGKGVSPLISCFTPRGTADSDCENLKAVDSLFKFGVSQATPRGPTPSSKLFESILEEAASTSRIIRVPPKDFDSDCSSDSSYSPEPSQKKMKVSLHCSTAAPSQKKQSKLNQLISETQLSSKYMTRSKTKKIFKETGKMPPMLELASSSEEGSPCSSYLLRNKAPLSSRVLYELKPESPELNPATPERNGNTIRFGFDEDSASFEFSEEGSPNELRNRKSTPRRKAPAEESYAQAQMKTEDTSSPEAVKPFMNPEVQVAEFTVVEEPCSLLAQFQKTLENPDIVTESLKKEEEVDEDEEEDPSVAATRFIKPKGTPRRQRKIVRPRGKQIRLKVPNEAERYNGKNRYRSKRFLNRLRQMWEKNRAYKKFLQYEEDRIFRADMKNLEGMFRQSQEDTQVKEQDEDVDTDEDVMENNRRFVLNELSKGVEAYLCQGVGPKGRLQKRQDLVRNYKNPDLCGFEDWN